MSWPQRLACCGLEPPQIGGCFKGREKEKRRRLSEAVLVMEKPAPLATWNPETKNLHLLLK
jgi:hypothetical protein